MSAGSLDFLLLIRRKKKFDVSHQSPPTTTQPPLTPCSRRRHRFRPAPRRASRPAVSARALRTPAFLMATLGLRRLVPSPRCEIRVARAGGQPPLRCERGRPPPRPRRKSARRLYLDRADARATKLSAGCDLSPAPVDRSSPPRVDPPTLPPSPACPYALHTRARQKIGCRERSSTPRLVEGGGGLASSRALSAHETDRQPDVMRSREERAPFCARALSAHERSAARLVALDREGTPCALRHSPRARHWYPTGCAQSREGRAPFCARALSARKRSAARHVALERQSAARRAAVARMHLCFGRCYRCGRSRVRSSRL